MLFNSYIFLFLFLPIALAGYYVLNHNKLYRLANVFLIGMSLWFYGYFNRSYLFIICGSILLNFFLAWGMEKFKERQDIKKLFLAVGICANIAIIFYYKYYDFFLSNVNVVFRQSFELKNIILPLGISFFTFQQISYLVDVFLGGGRGTFDEYALFVSFFPQLIAGPIVSYSEMIPQFRNRQNRHFIPENFSKSMYIFALGLFKKVIIADTFGQAAVYGFNNIELLSSMEALVVSLSYTFQLYFDFSGYWDMAFGVGGMFNVMLPQNFNSPYKATSIVEFWDRWHMSLTRFLRTYIYIPLGGNRKGRFRTYVNIMIVYLVSGIWHGANWTFILWGAFHGLFNCLNRMLKKYWEKLGRVTQWAITFMLVNMLWILFRAEDIASAKLFVEKLCSLSDFTVSNELYACFNLTELIILEGRIPGLKQLASGIMGFNLWLFIFGAFFVVLNLQNSKEIKFRPTIASAIVTVIFMSWSIVSLAKISTFLYFNF